MPLLPTGTITFLFTDLEGSTKLWEAHPDLMPATIARHDVLMRHAVEVNGGHIFKTTGDGLAAAFALAAAALSAALDAQMALTTEAWPAAIALRARMGLHTGLAELRDGDYFGSTLNRTARLMAAGHGGQILLSDATQELCRDCLPPTVTLLPLGGHRLKDLARPETIYQAQHPVLPADFPPLRTLDAALNNLPQQMTSFVGREKQLEEVKEHLSRTRLLTLTGPGGTGKTRLSLQVAADALHRYPDGAWLVELAALSDLSLVPQTVATALGLREQPGQSLTETLTEYLKAKRLLLLLDNCEHLVQACATLAAALVRACPNVTILATSREALNVRGEQTYGIPTLTLPDPRQAKVATAVSLRQFESVRLFVDRAQFVKSDFAVTDANAPALAQLCYRLDGIPLALELAAARVRSLPVEQINDKLGSRFRLLTGGDRSALPRQQTLRALIDWSYDLLTDSEKTLLARLSVFAGGWTLEAAESVCGFAPLEDWETLDFLTSLVDKSLLLTEDDAGANRYRMLETVREYATERLAASGELAEAQARHVAFFVALAEAAKPNLTGPEQVPWLNRLEIEHDNLRAALDFCAADSSDAALSGLWLAGGLGSFWQMRGYLTDGREQLGRALAARQRAALTADTSIVQKAVAGASRAMGSLACSQGDYASAIALGKESFTLYREIGDKNGIAYSLRNLGNVAFYQGDYALARSQFEEGLSLLREIGDKSGIAYSLMDLGNIATSQGEFASARSQITESLGLLREIGDKRGIAITLMNLGYVALHQGDLTSAQSQFEESLDLYSEVGDKRGIARTLINLGGVALHQSDFAAAWLRYEESLNIFREIGDKGGIAITLRNLGIVTCKQGDFASAWTYHEESLSLFREIGGKRGIASTLINLGGVASHQGDFASARSHYRESLSICREIGDKSGMSEGMEGMAMMSGGEGNWRLMVVLANSAALLRESIGAPPPPDDRAKIDAEVAKARAALGPSAFDAARAEGASMPWEQAVELVLGATNDG